MMLIWFIFLVAVLNTEATSAPRAPEGQPTESAELLALAEERSDPGERTLAESRAMRYRSSGQAEPFEADPIAIEEILRIYREPNTYLRSKTVEFGGIIYRYHGQLYASSAISGRSRYLAYNRLLSAPLHDQDVVREEIEVIALWHTHPNRSPASGPARRDDLFSVSTDVGNANSLNYFVYVGRGSKLIDRVNPQRLVPEQPQVTTVYDTRNFLEALLPVPPP
jgi:hypothetical protein